MIPHCFPDKTLIPLRDVLGFLLPRPACVSLITYTPPLRVAPHRQPHHRTCTALPCSPSNWNALPPCLIKCVFSHLVLSYVTALHLFSKCWVPTTCQMLFQGLGIQPWTWLTRFLVPSVELSGGTYYILVYTVLQLSCFSPIRWWASWG